MTKYYFSYKDPSIRDNFVRGHSITLDQGDLHKAIDQFAEEKPNCEILGVLVTNL